MTKNYIIEPKFTSIAEEFDKKGYFILEDVLTDEDVEFYITELNRIAKTKKKKTWTIPNGLATNKAFWDVIFKDKLVKAMKDALGKDAKFCQHNDLHVGYSSFAWHRDSSNRTYDPNLPDWQEDEDKYLVARAGFYLQPEENNFHLGLVPGSHKLSGYISEEEFLEMDKYLSNTQNIKAKIGLKDVLKEKAEWVKTSPKNCVIFDPRVIHTGGEFESEKYSFFLAFGNPNMHFKQHYTYYRHLRTDLKYEAFDPELADRLKANGLYAAEEKYCDKVEGAFVPSSAYSFVASFFE